jgi:hypothetical protein
MRLQTCINTKRFLVPSAHLFKERRKNEVITLGKHWTQEEKELLIKHYPFLSAKEINIQYIPNRTPEQITDYAKKKLKINKDASYHKGWNQEQLEFLKENYIKYHISVEEISKTIGKSCATITAMANSLNLFRENLFNEEEIQIIKEHYPLMKTDELQQMYLNDKTITQIIKFANDNGIFKTSEVVYDIRKENGINNLKFIPDQSGANSPRWKVRFEVNCAFCNSIIEKTDSKLQKSENNFCNYECMGNWMSDNLIGESNPNYNNGSAWTEEMRKKSSERSVKRLVESDFKFSKTKPEKTVDTLLDKVNIKYECEYDCKYYLIDRYLYDFNLMIEVQGNFFHCNPTMNLENNRKEKIIRKDKSKNTYIKKYKNINILYLWEKDINDNPELCEKLINLYVDANGILENYHSFNYENTLDGIKLKNDLTLMEY